MLDQSQGDIHRREFRHQSRATAFIFAGRQAYGSYVRFVINNLCMPANYLDCDNIDRRIKILVHVDRELVPETDRTISEAVKFTRKEIFEGSSNVPIGFTYWPNAPWWAGRTQPTRLTTSNAIRCNTMQDLG